MDEPAVLDQPEQHTKEDKPFVSPYLYQEFSGPGGERYLKKVLRQILPMALYRTWEIFADHQARGNDCYLSISQLALLAGRSLRTVQKNVASLQAKKLLVERAERKTFRGTNDQTMSRMVVVKDFSALYGLAHEYHQWCHSEEMIPPERAYVSLLSQNGELVAKLRRFDNYRRLLYNHVPVPGHVEQEEDRWFTEYRPGLRAEDMTCPQPTQDQSCNQSSAASTLTAKEPSKEVSKETPKRINESSQRDETRGDSSDSASAFSEPSVRRGCEGSRRRSSQPTKNELGTEQERGSKTTDQQQGTQPQPAGTGQNPACSSALSARERNKTSYTIQAAREAKAQANQRQAQQQRQSQTSGEAVASSQPLDHPLARSFLHEIAAPFGDRNPKGSTTRLLNILAHASLEEGEVVLCLVRAYTIARDTRTIHSAHSDRETGRANRMPLFCTLFERFVQARLRNDTWNYSWQQLEDDLTADDRLLLWWTERQALLAPNMPDSPEHHTPPAPSVPKERDEGEEEPPRIMGWARREAAHYWGEQLLEALIAAGYEAEVRVHLEGQCYQLLLVGNGSAWVLSTPLMVQEAIEILKNIDENQETEMENQKGR